MRYRAMLGLFVMVASVTGGCETTKTCTLIGCLNQLRAKVEVESGEFPSGAHRVEVTADGRSLSCTFTFPDPAGTGQSTTPPQCTPGLEITVFHAVSCTTIRLDGAIGQSCDPIADRLEETIAVDGMPGTVHVRQLVDGVTVLDRTATPTYSTFEPNGRGCGTCTQGTVQWTWSGAPPPDGGADGP